MEIGADIESIIKPETHIEIQMLSQQEFRKGCFYGEPRRGHPEGKVIFHIKEVLANVDKYATHKNREALRIIAITHDTFKHQVDRRRQKDAANNHGYFAWLFARRFIPSAQEILEVIKRHDEAFGAWRQGGVYGNWEKAGRRASSLIKTLKQFDALELYLAFYQCDNETGDKNRDNFEWFKQQAV